MLGTIINKLLAPSGFRLVRRIVETPGNKLPPRGNYPDICEKHWQIIQQVHPYTMTSIERLVGLIMAVEYLNDTNKEGAFVECGVWRGGSMMSAAYTMIKQQRNDRHMFLLDTYSGMTQPGALDKDYDDKSAADVLGEKKDTTQKDNYWCVADLGDVKHNVLSTGYPAEKFHFIKGDVRDTLCNVENLPGSIALLRLDTDWYESTRMELEILYPRLIPGGVLIIDDYGHWAGAKKAVDEYFQSKSPGLLCRLDYTGRIMIKPQSP